MTQTFSIYRAAGSTVPLRVQLKLNNVGVSLAGATVAFSMMDSQYWHGEQFQPPLSGLYSEVANLKVSSAVCAADSDTTNYPVASGWIVWSPTAANVDTPGNYVFQYKVTYGDGTIEYFPESLDEGRWILQLGSNLFLLP